MEPDDQFWQLKYFELMVHSQQVIAALSQPMIAKVNTARAAAIKAAAATKTKAD